ncbi:hypothetical protein TNCV_233121 [Trichonephila clavipes]|nr:hypothetical protein TNCV_233121 [Trichonephila clavipes]
MPTLPVRHLEGIEEHVIFDTVFRGHQDGTLCMDQDGEKGTENQSMEAYAFYHGIARVNPKDGRAFVSLCVA